MLTLFICACEDKISNHPQIYEEVPLGKWVNDYYAESQEPNYKDNKIYNDCLELTYEYYYEKKGEIKYFKQDMIKSDWKFVTEGELNQGIGVKRIKLTAKNPSDNYNNPPQSAIAYELLSSTNESYLSFGAEAFTTDPL